MIPKALQKAARRDRYKRELEKMSQDEIRQLIAILTNEIDKTDKGEKPNA